jgi:hypothetical protein
MAYHRPISPLVSPEQRHKLSTYPDELFKLRKVFESGGNLVHDSTIRGSAMQVEHQSAFHKAMLAKLASRPDLVALLIPSFAPGCRRLTPGKGFLESLLEPNVTVVSSSISQITPTGVETMTANTATATTATLHHEVDVLVCATGYHVSSPPPSPLLGRHGLPLSARWRDRAESYLSLAVDAFPNLLMMFGPNSAIGSGSLTKILEAEADYIIAAIRKLQKEDYASMEPRRARVRDFMEYVDGYFQGTVYTDECRSWYRGKDGKIVGLWPGSTLHALEALRSPRWEDWEYERVDEDRAGGGWNALRWLGNGSSVTQINGDPSWYINPDQVEVPLEGRPEENTRYKARPWSH